MQRAAASGGLGRRRRPSPLAALAGALVLIAADLPLVVDGTVGLALVPAAVPVVAFAAGAVAGRVRRAS
ncbi:hypothetical protein [Nocardiopsis coralliicola]